MQKLKYQNNKKEEEIEKLEHANKEQQRFYDKELHTLELKYAGERLLVAHFRNIHHGGNSYQSTTRPMAKRIKISNAMKNFNQRRKHYHKIFEAVKRNQSKKLQ